MTASPNILRVGMKTKKTVPNKSRTAFPTEKSQSTGEKMNKVRWGKKKERAERRSRRKTRGREAQRLGGVERRELAGRLASWQVGMGTREAWSAETGGS